MVNATEIDTFNEPFMSQPFGPKFLYKYSKKWEEVYKRKHCNCNKFSIMLHSLIVNIRVTNPLEEIEELYSEESILEDLSKHPGADGLFIYEYKKSILYENKEELSKIVYSFVQNLLWFKQIMNIDLERNRTKIFGVLCLLTEGLNKVQYYLGDKQSSICKILKIVMNIIIIARYNPRKNPYLKGLPRNVKEAALGLIFMKKT